MTIQYPSDSPAHNAEDSQTIFNAIRTINREGKKWTPEEASIVAAQYLIAPDQVFRWGERIYDHFKEEHNAYHGSIIHKVEAFLSDRYSFKRNALTRQVFIRGANDSGPYQPCIYNDIWRTLQHNLGMFGPRAKIPISDVQHLLESDYVKEYHPIRDYFNTLDDWDGTDYITQLGNHVECENQAFWLTQFKKCLVRMIACSYWHQENRIVMTLFTKTQSVGKNRFIKFLVPPALREYFKEDPIKDDKDAEIALTQNFVWHMDELESLSRKSQTSLKSFISRSMSKQRRPYDRQEVTRPRVVNFWASTNKDEFLADVQNTRWLCFRVNKIDWNYDNEETGTKTIDIDKVWAQAWALYNKKFVYQLAEDERVEQEILNQSFETMPIEKQLISKHLRAALPNAFIAEFMLPVDILKFLTEQVGGRINLNQFNITSAMSQLGFKSDKLNGKGMKGYWLLKINTPANGSQLPLEEKSPLTPDDVQVPF